MLTVVPERRKTLRPRVSMCTRLGTLAAALLVSACSGPREIPPAVDPPQAFDSPVLPSRRPHNLDESLRALERVLPGDLQLRMKRGSERDMILYWDDVGRWVRNSWLNGNQRQPLRDWFEATYGLQDSEAISGVILTSFWRYLHDQPLDVEGQIHVTPEQRRENSRAIDEQQRRMKKESAALNSSRITWAYSNVTPPLVTLPKRRTDDASVTTRYLAPFRDGVLVTSKYFRQDEWLPDQTAAAREATFHTRCYFADLGPFALQPVRLAETGPVDQCMVIGTAAYFHGVRAGKDVIVRLLGNERTVVPAPPGTGWLRLGRGEEALLAVRARAAYRYSDDAWTLIATTDTDLPRTAAPPRGFGGRLWFREEGQGFGTPGRLAWLPLDERRLRYYDDEVGWGHLWLGSGSIRQYDVAPDGTVWVTEERLVLANTTGTYSSVQVREWKVPPAGVAIEASGCALVLTPANYGDADYDGVPDDPTGMSARAHVYRACGGKVWPLFAIRRASQPVLTLDGELQWDWVPTHMVEALRTTPDGPTKCFVIGAEYGGLYVLTERAGEHWTAHSLDEAIGRTIEF